FSMLEFARVECELLAKKVVGSRSTGRGSMSSTPRRSISFSQHRSRSAHMSRSARDGLRRSRKDDSECVKREEEGEARRLLLRRDRILEKKEYGLEVLEGLVPVDEMGLPAVLDSRESER
ncbi:hypothetical protein KEM55_009071, partial [Ascosphaera atra]